MNEQSELMGLIRKYIWLLNELSNIILYDICIHQSQHNLP